MRASGQATSQDTVTTDKPRNKASISYLIEDLLTNLISRLTVGQEGGHPRTVWLGPQRVETLFLSISRGAEWALPALGEGSSGVRHSTGTKGRGSWGSHGSRWHVTDCWHCRWLCCETNSYCSVSEGDSTSQDQLDPQLFFFFSISMYMRRDFWMDSFETKVMKFLMSSSR